MKDLIKEVEKYVKDNIAQFHNARIEKLDKLKLNDLLKRKNPYLYKAKDLNTPGAIVDSLASAFVSSAEETIFGDWLEGLAIFIASKVYDAKKSTAKGIDMEMDKDGIRYIVSIKSGPNWSNSTSYRKQVEYFKEAQRVFRTSGNKMRCDAIEGCCYGKESSEKDTHTKLCGQAFWEFISGSNTLYTDIIEPLGTQAHEKNKEYKKLYNQKITVFTAEFCREYCKENGEIDWAKIVKYNSGSKM